VAIPLDRAAAEAAEVSLRGHIDVGEPFCHTIQTVLLRFDDGRGTVTSAVGGVWWVDEPPRCRTHPRAAVLRR
jgi:hypothetical protein